jgi:hypothetical protein
MGFLDGFRHLAKQSFEAVAVQSANAFQTVFELLRRRQGWASAAHVVLREERTVIARARKAKKLDEPPPETQPRDFVGLAFSGGGIRSATFNLGILQGLARYKLLHHVDYLSTVSGGGYIGTWLVAWIKRLAEPDPESRCAGDAPRALMQVQELLNPDQKIPSSIELAPIQNLRRYSNYLTPAVSLFNADIWTMAAIWFRNTLLNLTIIVCLVTVVLLPSRFAGLLLKEWHGFTVNLGPITVKSEALLSVIAMFVAAVFIAINLQRVSERARQEERNATGDQKLTGQPIDVKLKPSDDQEWVQRRVLIPATIGSIAVATWMYREPEYFIDQWSTWITLFLFAGFAVIAILGGFPSGFAARCARKTDPGIGWLAFAFVIALALSLVTGFTTAAMLFGTATAIQRAMNDSSVWLPWFVSSFGPPAVLLISAIGLALQAGLVGRDMPDATREWLGRLRAWSIIYGVIWMAVFAVSVFGPWLLYWTNTWVATAVGGGWILTTIAGLYAGNSERTAGNGTKGVRDNAKELVALVAPYVFMAGVFLLVSLGIHELVSPSVRGDLFHDPGPSATLSSTPEPVTLTVGKPERTPYTRSEVRLEEYENDLASARPGRWVGLRNLGQVDLYNLWMLFFTAIGAGALLAWRVDINEFSMHHFYKNRLVRCYLGASRKKRTPDAFTGFDGGDDFPLASLCPATSRPSHIPKIAASIYCGPFPIVNATLNITGGNALAWQERKAASYVFTPLYSGFDKPFVDQETIGSTDKRQYAFRPTDKCGYVGGIYAGQAMAISGAAASPNSGYHSSTAVAFFLTVLNARLGWWLGNPALENYYTKSSPTFGLAYLLVELFGLANTQRNYVNLSDAGHFDNLGIYELVRRRCKYIIACDGEQDGDMTFSGLASVIRKCETDFGATIDINVDQLRLNGDGRSVAHCAVGKIRYKDQRLGRDTEYVEGRLVYLKASLTGNEEPDVLEYQSRNNKFPHQSTGDQWFDESQFESYRRLGLHVAESTFGTIQTLDSRNGDAGTYDQRKAAFFEDVQLRHYPPSKLIAQAFTRHTETLTGLLNSFAQVRTFSNFDESVFSQWTPITSTERRTIEQERAARYWCNAIIQLMENVYVDLDLDDPKERDHPDNAGWLLLFRRWSVTPLFRRTWAIVASAYGARFQRFFERLQTDAGAGIQGDWKWSPPAAGAPAWSVQQITLKCSTGGGWDLTGSAIRQNGTTVVLTDIDFNGGRATFKIGTHHYRFALNDKRPGVANLALSTQPQQTIEFTR